MQDAAVQDAAVQDAAVQDAAVQGVAVQRYRTVELGRDRLVRLGVGEQSTLEGLDQQPSRARPTEAGRPLPSASSITRPTVRGRGRRSWKRTSGSGDAKPQGAGQ